MNPDDCKSKTPSYQVLARRYRPKNFHEMVGQEVVVVTLKNAIRLNRVAHAYLFCGSRGVGKTSLARLFAKALNCQNKGEDLEPCNQCTSCLEIGSGQSLDVIEIDGASNRGIDDVRQITETACYSPSFGHFKIYIIDEVHMLTKEAFNALLKTLEEPPEKAKFFFATTESHKVLPTIISRCQRFDLGRIQPSLIIGKLEQIAHDLQRTVDPEALHLIALFADGSLRDAESLFDQMLCFTEGNITAHLVREILGLVAQDHLFALDGAFAKAQSTFAFELVDTLFSSGKDLLHFFEQLIEHVRTLTLARMFGEEKLNLPAELAASYVQSARAYTPSQCLYLLEYLLRMESLLQKSACQRVVLEATLLHYIQSRNRVPVEILVRRLSELEQTLASRTAAAPADPSQSPAITTASSPEPPSRSLQPVPFNPFKETPEDTLDHTPLPPSDELEIASTNPSVATAAHVSAQSPEIPISNQMPPATLPPPILAKIPPLPAEAPIDQRTRYDTIMRFTAIELEGTLITQE